VSIIFVNYIQTDFTIAFDHFEDMMYDCQQLKVRYMLWSGKSRLNYAHLGLYVEVMLRFISRGSSCAKR
jgi:hypothetical protein